MIWKARSVHFASDITLLLLLTFGSNQPVLAVTLYSADTPTVTNLLPGDDEISGGTAFSFPFFGNVSTDLYVSIN